MTTKTNSTLYTGITSNLPKRAYQHRNASITGFTKRYHIKKLVYYEIHHDIHAAITREKQLKKWKRAWKNELIEQLNPYWQDLYQNLF